ncbi:MAG: nicotinamide riboside transporter PnuC, partial [Balneola sp.]
MPEIIEGIFNGVIQTSALEWVAVICGVASVIYSMRENILVYPTGIISVIIYVYLAFQYKLYADMGVNGYYFVMSVYGWYYWTNTEGAKEQIEVTVNSATENIYSL